MSDIPEAISESELQISGFRLRVYHLDDGRRIINKDDMDSLLEAIANGTAFISQDEYMTALHTLKASH